MSSFQYQLLIYGTLMALVWPWFLRDLPATVSRARARGGLPLLGKLVAAFGVIGTIFPLMVLFSGVRASEHSAIWGGAVLALINGVFGALGWAKYNELSANL